jgi:small subunit ribosomal protein S17
LQKNKKARVAKEITGRVVSHRMDKTIVVRASRLALHPVFKKRVRRFNKFKAHDEKNAAKTGDLVKIKEARPFSKTKRWGLVKIMEKAEE